jgi:hypothetical protein
MKGQQPTKVMKLMRLTLQVCPKSAMIIISRTFSTKQNQDFIISIRNFCLSSQSTVSKLMELKPKWYPEAIKKNG